MLVVAYDRATGLPALRPPAGWSAGAARCLQAVLRRVWDRLLALDGRKVRLGPLDFRVRVLPGTPRCPTVALVPVRGS